MRRSLATFAASLFLLLVVAAPAFAHERDPFDPAISSNNVQPGPNNNDSNGDGTNGDGTPVGPSDHTGGRDNLPSTGRGVDAWVVLSYGLIAAGATALGVARMRRPLTYR
jgi:hypothetical protein